VETDCPCLWYDVSRQELDPGLQGSTIWSATLPYAPGAAVSAGLFERPRDRAYRCVSKAYGWQEAGTVALASGALSQCSLCTRHPLSDGNWPILMFGPCDSPTFVCHCFSSRLSDFRVSLFQLGCGLLADILFDPRCLRYWIAILSIRLGSSSGARELIHALLRAAATGLTSPKKHSPKSFRFTKREAGGVYRLHGQCQGIDCWW